jgi:hypothetical protein
MSVLTIPYPAFVNGTASDAALINANNAAIAAQVNNINCGNIGTLGIYASQIVPTSGAHATFGGTLGYNFLAPAVGATPLTVSGVTSQTADIFDVTLTSGGQLAFAVGKTGVAMTAQSATGGRLPSVREQWRRLAPCSKARIQFRFSRRTPRRLTCPYRPQAQG